MYRNNNNINDLINRFEVTNDDDFDMTENLKYSARHNARRAFKMQSDDENFANDENRSLMKYNSDRSGGIFVRQTPTVSGVKEFIKQLLLKISALLEMISKFPFPRMSVMSFGLTSLLAVFLAPRGFTDRVLYPGFKILFTIIYPAYRSFKAVRNKNLKEYLKWIVYWIVFAFFTCLELVTDALLNWFPFYYEIKVIFLIWILGPSSKGAMKVYKNIIHPMLISREQEIDDVIQLAQDYGYMQVFRLSSKSVNYANKIIMQDTKADTGGTIMVSHQLMKNISLSNISDAGTIQSNDENDELFRMRRFSLDKAPYERRKPSFDYRYDDTTMSSGYASPTQLHFTSSRNPQRGAYIEENVGSCDDLSRRKNSLAESIPRKASITELSDDEIIIAYHNLLKQQQQQPQKVEVERTKTSTHDDEGNYREFLRWMEMKKNVSLPQPPTPLAIPLKEEKVNTSDVNDDAINVVADDEKENEKDPIDAVVKECVSIPPKDIDPNTIPTIEMENDDEFKDAISDDYLNVPLVIHENDDEVIITTNEPETEKSVVNATLTLSNDALQITTNLSTSNMSLASSNDENKKKPARHGKGRAPPPPTQQQPQPSTSTSNVIEGYYYDELTNRHFKETEL